MAPPHNNQFILFYQNNFVFALNFKKSFDEKKYEKY